MRRAKLIASHLLCLILILWLPLLSASTTPILRAQTTNLKPDQLPVPTANINTPTSNYPVAKKFNLALNRAPAGTIVINKPQSFYEKNRQVVWRTLIIFLILVAMLLVMLVNLRKRLRLEKQLRDLNNSLNDDVRKRSSELDQSENRFRLMMESMNDPVYICSPDYRVEYMNPAMIKRVGRDAVGDNCYQAIHDYKQRCPWCQYRPDSQNKFFDLGILSPRDEHYYHISYTPIQNSDNSSSMMIIFRDITELKKLERQLRQIQQLESIGTLTGGIAHDFNNIMTAIYGYSEAVLENLTEDSRVWQDVREIQKSSEQATALTQQLLAFSRSQKSKPRPVNFNTVLVEMGGLLGRLIGEDIQLETSIAVDTGNILADPTQLKQIIVNLVVNARDALNEKPATGKRIIKISTSKVYLDESFQRRYEGSSQGPHLLVEVADNGCGMNTEVLEHIFDPFFTTKEVGQGTGMGLSIIYGILKQNHANIYTESTIGQGSIFKVYWPLTDKPLPAAEKSEADSGSTTPGSETILFVEDDDHIRKIIARKFQEHGYQLLIAANGREALALAAAHKGEIRLLFTDVIMPVMGGKELADEIKKFYPEIKIIFVSGYLDDRIHKEILIQGNFICKPYTFKAVNKIIRKLLDDTV